MMNLFSLEGKTILITGASSGIGKSIAMHCSQMGANLFITARNEERLKSVIAELQGNQHTYIISDLTKQSDVLNLINVIPKIDGVVHCSGIGSSQLCKFITREDIDNVMGTNFYAPVLLQAALLERKKLNKNASVVFVASHAATSPALGNAVYSASKGAIISYANCLALELATRGIRVNCISPAMVWTDLITKEGIDVRTLKEDEKFYPLGRYGTPEDISPLAVYLLSDASKWMTTSNLKITGGGELTPL